MIHDPDCVNQGDHLLSYLETVILNNNIIHLGGVVCLQSTERIGRLYKACPAQDFVNCMEAKIEDLILTA